MSRKNKTHDSGQRNKSELRETAVKYQASSQPDTEAPIDDHGDQGWIDFREQCRRQMQRPMALRIKYGFCRTMPRGGHSIQWRNTALGVRKTFLSISVSDERNEAGTVLLTVAVG